MEFSLRGIWTKSGRFDRKIITVDPRKTLTARASYLHIEIKPNSKPNSDYELISALLTLLHGKTPHHSVEDITGVPIFLMEEMLDLMKNCNFGVISVGVGLSSSFGKYRDIEIAMNLAKKLNNYSTFTLGMIHGHSNAAGFSQIASCMYGYPFGIDFSHGYPHHNPGEFTTIDVLREKDVDAAFVLGTDLLVRFPLTVQPTLQKFL